MAEKLNIYLREDDRAQNIRVWLDKRVKECDLIIHSLPNRRYMSGDNALVLSALVESYTLFKSIAVRENCMALASHIDDMLVLCYAQASSDMALQAQAAAVNEKAAQANTSELVIHAQAAMSLIRYRLLSEMDNFPLSVFDGGTVEDADLIET